MSAGPGNDPRPRVVVIGGGLTGLATAWRLRGEMDVTLLEASDRPGGQIRSLPFAGTTLDVGADAFLARQPEGERLARDLGFTDDDLVAPVTSRVHLWVRGRRRPLPQGTVMGVPADLGALARSGVLRVPELLRVAAEPMIPRRDVVGDRSVADLVGERFGRAVVDRLVEPLLGGVYAGSVERLSAQAAIAPVWTVAERRRSLRRGLRAHRAKTATNPAPVFLTLRGGLGGLVDRLVDDLGAAVRTATTVRALARDAGGWSIALEDGSVLGADRVVLAVPAAVASRLVDGVSSDAARELAGIGTASVGVVALAYEPAAAIDLPAGSGLLVSRSEGGLVKAVTFTSRKWPHHAGHDRFLLRASVGRVGDTRTQEWDDDRLIAEVSAEVGRRTGLAGRPVDALVQRWPQSLPQYDVGHLSRVDRIRHALGRDAPGLHVGGAAFDGLGLSARARDAERLAQDVRRSLALG